MSVEAIGRVTQAMRGIMRARLAGSGVDTPIFVGSPGLRPDGSTALISLFLFHLEPNREMRNAPRALADAGATDLVPQDALPVDLRYLISFFRADAGSDTDDLLRLGSVIAALHASPTIAESLVPGQTVRVTPEPYPMEEISRVWSLFANKQYVTSVVYLASPVFVDASAALRGGPVVSRRVDSGHSAEAPDVFRPATPEVVG